MFHPEHAKEIMDSLGHMSMQAKVTGQAAAG